DRVMTRTICGLATVCWLLGCSGSPSTSTSELNGGGSTFVLPLMLRWTNQFEKSEGGFEVDYQPLGSGSGIKGMISKKRDFGCTDGPLTDEELAAAQKEGGEVLHIPLVLGAVVPIYHIPDLKEPLHFTGPVLADIYLGKIKKWNDEAL